AVGLAKRTASVMRQNIGIALVTVVVLLAGVFAGGVTMSIGMLVHEASVLVVLANAMRLLRSTRGSAAAPEQERPTPTAAQPANAWWHRQDLAARILPRLAPRAEGQAGAVAQRSELLVALEQRPQLARGLGEQGSIGAGDVLR